MSGPRKATPPDDFIPATEDQREAARWLIAAEIAELDDAREVEEAAFAEALARHDELIERPKPDELRIVQSLWNQIFVGHRCLATPR